MIKSIYDEYIGFGVTWGSAIYDDWRNGDIKADVFRMAAGEVMTHPGWPIDPKARSLIKTRDVLSEAELRTIKDKAYLRHQRLQRSLGVAL